MRLTPAKLTLPDLRAIARAHIPLELDPACWSDINASAEVVARIVAADQPAYGINTGFGKLANTHIALDRLEQLQTNLVLSHSVGVGGLLDDDTVRLVLALKIASLARGYSGVRASVIEELITLYNARAYPCIPAKGSVGASGDLAPLAHMTAALMGLGELRIDGRRMPAREGLAQLGLQPLQLAAKEGLALLNGTQVSTALALQGLFAAEDAFASAMVSGALAVDAARGSDAPFDDRIHMIRGHA